MWQLTVLATIIMWLPETDLLYLNIKYNPHPYILERAVDDGPYIEFIEQHIQHVYLHGSYEEGFDDQVTIETNTMIDTKQRTWKRNADLINMLLALPKGLTEAGR